MKDDRGTYASAGVDIDAAQRALRSVKEAVTATHGSEVIGGIGGFGAMFQPDFSGVERPILVSSVDGVGTKTKVAALVGDYSGIGKDIVNHCVNDILCQGARPLFFLDYFGCSRLEENVFNQVVSSAAQACKEVGCALIGGETAEMPGVYVQDETDVVGCIVGVVDYARRLPSTDVSHGDSLIGIASSGLHTNGYSLARHVLFEQDGLGVGDVLDGASTTIGAMLLEPHKCYYNALHELMSEGEVKALAHITGGGLYDNLSRVLPPGVQAVIEKSAWKPQQIFLEIQSRGRIDAIEMYRAFNMGIGMVAVVAAERASKVVERLKSEGEDATVIGELRIGSNDVVLI